MKNRVVITAVSISNALGNSLDSVVQKVIDKKSGFSKIPQQFLPPQSSSQIGARMENIVGDNRYLTLFEKLFQPLKNKFDNPSTPLIIGTVFPGVEEKRFIPIDQLIPKLSEVSGFPETLITFNSNTCASGNFAIAQGVRNIALGLNAVVIAGGIDILSSYLYAGFSSLKNLSDLEPRPFSSQRKGLGLGEGGAFFILENLEKALQKGRKILAEVIGFGASADGQGITGMDKSGEGIQFAIIQALQSARLSPKDIDYIGCHGTGTKLNDQIEAKVITSIFGSQTPVQAFKSYWGHPMGAAAALEAAMAVYSLEKQLLLPLNYLPDMDLNFIIEPHKTSIQYAINLAFGFGGINSALVLKRYEN
ncbi:MAG: hypothetical protein MJB14_14630 [Spirochaetes bacterium]|nr:hypothetical protein [Spirochaetota bacterium]